MRYLFNYSAQPASVNYPFEDGHELLSGESVKKGSTVKLEPWGVKIIEGR